MKNQTAIFAMGCFWSPDLLFSKIPGVIKAEVGYIGGNEKKFPNPTYEQVCSSHSGYAEAIKIEFDSDKMDYNTLLDLFFQNHNPTTKNRQGLDIGSQYRSEIFYTTEEQKKKAQEAKKKYQKDWGKSIVTEITKAKKFFPAEDYHQNYLKKQGKTSCRI